MDYCWVYKAFHCSDPADQLLYVGISDTPSERMNQHGRDKWWWHLVDRIEWFRVDSRNAAAKEETWLITHHKPLFNKHQSTLTAGSVLLGCLDLIKSAFHHCPLCHSACRYSIAKWEAKYLCTVDVGEHEEAYCFDVRMQCAAHHDSIEWTQLIPIDVLCECKTRMPQSVLSDLWQAAECNGEVSEDIPELRAPTLADFFVSSCLEKTQSNKDVLHLIEAN